MTTQQVAITDSLASFEESKRLCTALLATPHYAKIGEVGVFAIVQKAKSLGMDPIDALNGGLYFVNGKVEMPGQQMLHLIRRAGHSVQVSPDSSQNHVKMIGKRCDNGDTWTVSFGIEDAKRAGIYKASWERYPQIMCMWRCVSMLGRFLFSDVIKGCYVEGEISDAPPINAPVVRAIEYISIDQREELQSILSLCDPVYQKKVSDYLSRDGIESLDKVPVNLFKRMLDAASQEAAKYSEIMEVKMAQIADRFNDQYDDEGDA